MSTVAISEKQRLKKVLVAGALLMVVHGVIFTLRHTSITILPSPSSSILAWSLTAVKALYSSLTVIHYYLDRQIFRMRDSHTKTQIGPLIAA
jgi:hypothetical protein